MNNLDNEDFSETGHIVPNNLTPTQCLRQFSRQHFNHYQYSNPNRTETSIRYKNNEPWGDPISNKKPGTIRLYFCNINGLCLDTQGGKLKEILGICDALQVDILGLSEINTDTLQYKAKQIIYETHKKIFQVSKHVTSTSRIKSTRLFKPGGTLLSAFGNITGRIISDHQDPMGRWNTMLIIGRQKSICIISAYQVPHQAVNGPHTASTQQTVMIASNTPPGETILHPRQKFIQDLDALIQEHLEQSHEIILVGDFNETVFDSLNGIKGIISRHNLIDILRHQHPQTPVPTTYNRGSRCLDYALVTPGIASYVQDCGYGAFGEHVQTDHRPLYLDLEDTLVSKKMNPMCSQKFRDVRSSNSATIPIYLEKRYQYLIDHRVFERIETLTNGPFDQALLESIDRDMTRACLSAEKYIRQHKRPGEWSVRLHQTRRKIRLAQLVHSQITTRRDFSQQIQTLSSMLPGFNIPKDIEECKQTIVTLRRQIRSILQEDKDIRKEELEIKAAQLELKNPKSKKAKTLRRLIRAEESSKVYQKLKMVRGKLKNNTTLQRIDIPIDEEANTWESLTDPEEIEKKLQERNAAHFRQAHGTPWTIGKLQEITNYTGTTQGTQQILDGTIEVQDEAYDETTQKYLPHLRRLIDPPPLEKVLITTEEFTSKLKKWRETTATSPSGVHLGHYKMLVAPVPKPSTEEQPTNPDQQLSQDSTLDPESMQTCILDAHLTILNQCITHSTILDRWTKVASVMLEKDPGKPKITRLRVIHLFEADYNFLLGLRWQQTVTNAVQTEKLNPSQHAVTGSNSIVPVLLEEAQYEMCRLTRYPLLRFDNDAKACYDRIIPNLSVISSLRLGLHPHLASINGQVLARTQYHLKTNHGLSEEWYRHDPPNAPVYGSGQGAGNSPAVWTGQMCSLFDCHDEYSQGATYTGEKPEDSITIGMTGYVDDSTYSINSLYNRTLMHLLIRGTFDTQSWSNLLTNAGGALSLDKCSFHLIVHAFKPSGEAYLEDLSKKSEYSITLQTYDGTDNVPIKSLSPSEAHRTLGCYKSPDGKQVRQADELQAKSDHYAGVVNHSALTWSETRTFYSSIFVPSVSYPLPTCHFLQETLQKIQSQAHLAIFAAAGFNRRSSHDLMFAPLHIGGGGFYHLYDLQGIGQIQHIMTALRKPKSQLGRMFQVLLYWYQRHLGISYNAFSQPDTVLPHSTASKWLTSMRKYLHDSSLWLEFQRSYTAPLQRQNDFHLMDRVLEAQHFTPGQIRRINYCRMHLQVELASDICLADGVTLDPSFLKGTPSLLSSRSRKQGILQARPDETSWRLWRKANFLWSQKGKLEQPLGAWLTPEHERLRQWLAYRDPVTRKVYISTLPHTPGYDLYTMSTTLVTSAHPSEHVNTLPSGAHPVQVESIDSGWRIHLSRNSHTIPDQPPDLPGYPFYDHLASKPIWIQTMLQHLHPYVDLSDAATIIQQSQGASDGSHLETRNVGSYGWAIGTRENTHIECYGPSFNSTHGSSYRAEATGLLSLSLFLSVVTSFLELESVPPIRIHCDNKGLVNKINHSKDSKVGPRPLSTDWDILQELHTLWSSDAFQHVTLHHVKGHADRRKPPEEWTIAEALNIRSDQLAAEGRQEADADEEESSHDSSTVISRLQFNPQQAPLLGQTVVQLHTRSRGTITSRYKTAIHYSRTSPQYYEYLRYRWGWDRTVLSTLDYTAFQTLFKATKHQHLIPLHTQCKLVNNLLPIGRRLHRIESHRPSTCPLCDTIEEDIHIPVCPHESRATWRRTFLSELDSFLDDTQNQFLPDPDLAFLVRDGITQYLLQTPPVCPVHLPHLQEVWRQQQAIGWYHFFTGHISTGWHDLQAQHLRTQSTTDDKPITASKWINALLSLTQTHWAKLWRQRNSDIHGISPQDNTAKLQQRLWARILQIDAQYSYLDPGLQALYDRIKLRQIQTPAVLQQWLHTYEELFTSQAIAYTRALRRSMRPITDYFPRKDV